MSASTLDYTSSGLAKFEDTADSVMRYTPADIIEEKNCESITSARVLPLAFSVPVAVALILGTNAATSIRVESTMPESSGSQSTFDDSIRLIQSSRLSFREAWVKAGAQLREALLRRSEQRHADSARDFLDWDEI